MHAVEPHPVRCCCSSLLALSAVALKARSRPCSFVSGFGASSAAPWAAGGCARDMGLGGVGAR